MQERSQRKVRYASRAELLANIRAIHHKAGERQSYSKAASDGGMSDMQQEQVMTTQSSKKRARGDIKT